jgi:hypothetical protein
MGFPSFIIADNLAKQQLKGRNSVFNPLTLALSRWRGDLCRYLCPW